MKILPTVLTAEVLKDVVRMRHFFTLTTDSDVYRWTDGNNSVYYNGFWYVSSQISIDQSLVTLTSVVDTLVLSIANVDKTFSNLALSTQLRGKSIVIQTVLLDTNWYVVGVPVTIFSGYFDSMVIDRGKAKIQCFNEMIKWKTQTPRRMHSQTCSWIFMGTECAYAGLLYLNPISDIAPGFTRSLGSYNYANVNDRATDLTAGNTISADSNDGAGHVAANACDDNNSTYWASASTALPHWLRCQFSSPKKVATYSIFPVSQAAAPTYFKLQGSNDGSTWSDLDVRTGVSWPTPVRRTFDVHTPSPYTYYQIYVMANVSGNTTSIYEFELIGTSDEVNDADYNYTSSTSAQADLFGLPAMALSSDVSGIVVTVRVRAKQVTASARNLAGRLRVFGTDYDATAITPATTFTGYDFVWLQNPYSGAAWQYNEAGPPADDLTLANTAGTASADYYYASSVPAQAFDNNLGTNWDTYGSALPHWLQFLFSSAKKVLGYTLVGYSNPSYSPTAWTIQGSNNGSSWTTLDTRSGISWSANEKKWFKVATPGTYTYYRIYITAGGVSGEVIIVEMEYFDGLFINGFGYSTPADAGGHEVDVSQCYLKSSNSTTGMTCDYTPTRCAALNNRANFGGFFYIPEMAVKQFWWGTKQKIFTGPY